MLLSDPSEFIGIALTGDIERVRECLSVCPDMVNQKEKDHGNVALHVASSKGNLSMASLLLSKGANLNIQDIFGNSPLHYAVDKRRKEMAEMLIKCGADVNLKDFRGNTPLHIACANSDIDMVRLLLLHNADPELSDLSDAKPAQKTTSAPIRTLIERKLKMNHGGEEDAASKIVTMMSFGIGLGKGVWLHLYLPALMQFPFRMLYRRRFGHGDGEAAADVLRAAAPTSDGSGAAEEAFHPR